MHLGTIKYYNATKGYGFIIRDDGQRDVFVHSSDLRASGFTTLDSGDRVHFDTKPAKDDNRSPVACNIQLFDAGGNLRERTIPAPHQRADGANLIQQVFGS